MMKKTPLNKGEINTIFNDFISDIYPKIKGEISDYLKEDSRFPPNDFYIEYLYKCKIYEKIEKISDDKAFH